MAQQDVYQTIWSFSHPDASGEMSTSMHFRLSGVNVVRTEKEYCRDLAEEVVTIIEDLYLQYLPNTMTFNRVECFNVTQPIYFADKNSNTLGLKADQPVSLRSTVNVEKKTGLRGRSFRGRSFLMAPTEDVCRAGVLDNTFRTNIDDFITNMLIVTSVDGNVYNATVWSEKEQLDNLISNFGVQPNAGTIKGRMAVS